MLTPPAAETTISKCAIQPSANHQNKSMLVRAQQPGWDNGADATAAHPYEAHWGVDYAASLPPEPHSRPCECFSSQIVLALPSTACGISWLTSLCSLANCTHCMCSLANCTQPSRVYPHQSRWSSYPLDPERQPCDSMLRLQLQQLPAAASQQQTSGHLHCRAPLTAQCV
jgi:hypothetical protein